MMTCTFSWEVNLVLAACSDNARMTWGGCCNVFLIKILFFEMCYMYNEIYYQCVKDYDSVQDVVERWMDGWIDKINRRGTERVLLRFNRSYMSLKNPFRTLWGYILLSELHFASRFPVPVNVWITSIPSTFTYPNPIPGTVLFPCRVTPFSLLYSRIQTKSLATRCWCGLPHLTSPKCLLNLWVLCFGNI